MLNFELKRCDISALLLLLFISAMSQAVMVADVVVLGVAADPRLAVVVVAAAVVGVPPCTFGVTTGEF